MFNVFLSGNLSDILFGILYGMLNCVLSGAFTGFIRAFTLAIFGTLTFRHLIWHYLTFSVAFVLTFYLAINLTIYWHPMWYFSWSSVRARRIPERWQARQPQTFTDTRLGRNICLFHVRVEGEIMLHIVMEDFRCDISFTIRYRQCISLII